MAKPIPSPDASSSLSRPTDEFISTLERSPSMPRSMRFIGVKFDWLVGYHFHNQPPEYVNREFNFAELMPEAARDDVFKEYRFNMLLAEQRERFRPDNRNDNHYCWEDHEALRNILIHRLRAEIPCNARHPIYAHAPLEPAPLENKEYSVAWYLKPRSAPVVFAPWSGGLLWAGMCLSSPLYCTDSRRLSGELVGCMRLIPRILPAKVNQTCSLVISVALAPASGLENGTLYDLLTLKKLATMLWVGEDYFSGSASAFRKHHYVGSLSLTKYSNLADDELSDLDVHENTPDWLRTCLHTLGETPAWLRPIVAIWEVQYVNELAAMLSANDELSEEFKTDFTKGWTEPLDFPEDATDWVSYHTYDLQTPVDVSRYHRCIFDFDEFLDQTTGVEAFNYRGMQSRLDDPRAIQAEWTFWDAVVRFANESTEEQFQELIVKLARESPTRDTFDFLEWCDARIPYIWPDAADNNYFFPLAARRAYFEKPFEEWSPAYNICTGDVRGWGKQILPQYEPPRSDSGDPELEALARAVIVPGRDEYTRQWIDSLPHRRHGRDQGGEA